MKEQEITLILVAVWAIVQMINGIIGLRENYRLSKEIKMRRKEEEEENERWINELRQKIKEQQQNREKCQN